MNSAFKKFDLTGKTALVTGGATGIGYYMTRGLMRSGARVMVAARREAVLKEAAARLRSESESGEILCHGVDLGRRASIQALADHAIETMGGVDIFIGNAAQDLLEPVDKITDVVIDRMFQVNVSSNIELVRAFLPGMRKKKWGRIVFSSSITSIGTTAAEGTGVYGATKSALNSFARTVATEAGHDGITVNSLLLGAFLTEMMEGLLAQTEKAQGKAAAKGFIDSVAGMTALGRMGRPYELEGLIQFITSDAASYLTGTCLSYDGGWNAVLRPHAPPAEPVYPTNS